MPATTAIVLVGAVGALAFAAIRLHGFLSQYFSPDAQMERERIAKHARLTREFRARERS